MKENSNVELHEFKNGLLSLKCSIGNFLAYLEEGDASEESLNHLAKKLESTLDKLKRDKELINVLFSSKVESSL